MYVENVVETLEFYEKAFGCQRLFVHESGDYGELSTGETKLAFSSLSLMQSLGKSPGNAAQQAPVFEIAFETDNVKQAFDIAIGAGAILVEDVVEMSWGQTVSYVRDINGFLVEICSPVN